MKKPILVILAAGMGSRYGGIKQMDDVGPNGQMIIDYSIYDAHKAGFETVVCIVREDILEEFKETIGARVSKKMEVRYAIQKLSDVPEGVEIPEGREKPWGTTHALYAAREQIDAPFVVINADDMYGAEAYKLAYDFLETAEDNDVLNCAMVGYQLKNTVTKTGHVSRGICTQTADGYLEHIDERKQIQLFDDGIRFTEDEGNTWVDLDPNSLASMNYWAMSEKVMEVLNQRILSEFELILESNPMTGETLLPETMGRLIEDGTAKVKVLSSPDKWYGVTYREDKEMVEAAVKKMTEDGVYPEDLWA